MSTAGLSGPMSARTAATCRHAPITRWRRLTKTAPGGGSGSRRRGSPGAIRGERRVTIRFPIRATSATLGRRGGMAVGAGGASLAAIRRGAPRAARQRELRRGAPRAAGKKKPSRPRACDRRASKARRAWPDRILAAFSLATEDFGSSTRTAACVVLDLEKTSSGRQKQWRHLLQDPRLLEPRRKHPRREGRRPSGSGSRGPLWRPSPRMAWSA